MLARLLLVVSAILSLGTAQAQPSGPCASPQAAVRTLLLNLPPNGSDPAAAAACLGGDFPDAPDRAARLKKVLDARGLYVSVDAISADPDHTNAQGLPVVTPLANFPQLLLRKEAERWVISEELVADTGRLYAETFSGLSGTLQEAVPASLQGRFLGLETWQWAYLALLLGTSGLVGLLVQLVLADQMLRLARKAKVNLDASRVAGTRWPLTLLFTGILLLWGIPDVQLGVNTSRFLLFVANAVASLAAVLMLVRLIDLVASYFKSKAEGTASKLDDQVLPLLQRAATGAVWVLGIVFVMQNVGVDVASLLAGLSIGGLAFALAAKDTVENLFGSITIFIDKPFQIGDWVVVGDGVEGVVEEVGFRSTRIRTFYGSLVSVPNGKVAHARIDNKGRRTFRRVKTTLAFTYGATEAQLGAFVTRARDFLKSNPAVADTTCEVHFAAFSASSLDVMVYFFLDVPDWTAELDERAKCYFAFLRIAEEEGLSFAFPSQSLYVEQMPPVEAR